MKLDFLIIPLLTGLVSYNSYKRHTVEPSVPVPAQISTGSLTLMEAIVTKAKEWAIDPAILVVIAKKESSFGKIDRLYRFEPKMFERLKKHRSYRHMSDSNLRMLASSHGPFHILGVTALERCDTHFSKLYSNKDGADCASQILSEIQVDVGGDVKETFRRYNGKGKMAERYAKDAMALWKKLT